jgi:hypothetical protein
MHFFWSRRPPPNLGDGHLTPPQISLAFRTLPRAPSFPQKISSDRFQFSPRISKSCQAIHSRMHVYLSLLMQPRATSVTPKGDTGSHPASQATECEYYDTDCHDGTCLSFRALFLALSRALQSCVSLLASWALICFLPRRQIAEIVSGILVLH